MDVLRQPGCSVHGYFPGYYDVSGFQGELPEISSDASPTSTVTGHGVGHCFCKGPVVAGERQQDTSQSFLGQIPSFFGRMATVPRDFQLPGTPEVNLFAFHFTIQLPLYMTKNSKTVAGGPDTFLLLPSEYSSGDVIFGFCNGSRTPYSRTLRLSPSAMQLLKKAVPECPSLRVLDLPAQGPHSFSTVDGTHHPLCLVAPLKSYLDATPDSPSQVIFTLEEGKQLSSRRILSLLRDVIEEATLARLLGPLIFGELPLPWPS
ncbi:hypothetical protein E2C01_052689 [Portunus trituberculatus]|uniref:Uncharacterized protein n=1 Tax=Portunus trituberculatus TaxID=210409 RepID=A0A5B7GIC5_PORTR|nr:hypothetical protein [Portunus trituberculatus]